MVPTSRGFQMETSQRRKLLMFSFLYFLFTVSLFVNRILMMNYGHVMMWNSHVQTRFYAVVRNWWEIRIASEYNSEICERRKIWLNMRLLKKRSSSLIKNWNFNKILTLWKSLWYRIRFSTYLKTIDVFSIERKVTLSSKVWSKWISRHRTQVLNPIPSVVV